MINILQPWPWWVGGPLIGLMVPLLLIVGNRSFGISSSLRHVCAACFPADIAFFRYNWKAEIWNLFFVAGIVAGAAIGVGLLSDSSPVAVAPGLSADLARYGISNYQSQVPLDLFNWHSLLSARGFILIVIGGFLVGFGTRWAGGCTSGHSIFGLSTLQWPSLVATICFLAGGFLVANLVLPFILRL